MKPDIKDVKDIRLFVDTFYTKIQADELLGPVFALRIKAIDWSPHLKKMYGFWNTVLFAQREYRGNPFARHIGLPVDKHHFARWVELFHATIDENFQGEKAEDAKQRAEKMAMMFQHKLAFLANTPNYNPII